MSNISRVCNEMNVSIPTRRADLINLFNFRDSCSVFLSSIDGESWPVRRNGCQIRKSNRPENNGMK